MIYAGKMHNISPVGTELEQYLKLTPEDIAVFEKYMDTSVPRDNSLIKNLSGKYEPDSAHYSWRFNEAVEKYVLRRNDTELINRYIIFCYNLCGCRCSSLIIPFIDMHKDPYGKKYIVPAIEEFYSEAGEKESRLYAESAYIAIHTYRCSYVRSDTSAEICLCAAEITEEAIPDVSLKIAASALDRFGKDIPSPIIEKLTAIIRKISEKHIGHLPMFPADLTAHLLRPCLAVAADFDLDCRKLFRQAMEVSPEELIPEAHTQRFNLKHIGQTAVEENIPITLKYVQRVMSVVQTYDGSYRVSPEPFTTLLETMRPHLTYLAQNYESHYVASMKSIKNAFTAKKVFEILSSVNPEYNAENDAGLKAIALNGLINTIGTHIAGSNEDCQNIIEYVLGRKSREDVQKELSSVKMTYMYGNDVNRYCFAYGTDGFVRRSIVVTVYCHTSDWSLRQNLAYIADWENADYSAELAKILIEEKIPEEKLFMCNVNTKAFIPYADTIAEMNLKNLSAEHRCVYIDILKNADADRYKEQLFAAANTSSKNVREAVAKAIPKITNCQPEVEKLLGDRKAAKRETALEIIANMPECSWSEALNTALEKEKSEKLRVKIMSLLGIEDSGNTSEIGISELVSKLTKGGKTRKLEWLYKSAFSPVHLNDGEEASEQHMQALLLCYSGNDNENGKILGNCLNPDELAKFAEEVLGKWIDSGAEAKNKWVLIFASVWGNSGMIQTFLHYINEWSQNMRGAMAVAAVKALALNGSSAALMQVDNIARKFKKKQVKYAANEAMFDAAEFLGITQEELADRIVPDLGFDEKMCRTFDYGTRQFSVYLTPSLEIEIYNGDKKVKNMPKPGVNDTAEIADKSYADFKEMKKQLKTAVSVQKARLEYALMCERKWTAENWEKLFVKNPVMHCFAIGLIWGIYKDGELVSSFRYMDDGSFTTADEDEFEIPENAVISIVHPVELTEDEISAWKEQLSDYEIVQPFPQLERKVFRVTPEESGSSIIERFNGKEAVNLTFASRMMKNNWDKGSPEDAGMFYQFTRCDISGRVKKDGKLVPEGWCAELEFSGMYIGVFSEEADEITVGTLSFYSAGDKILKALPAGEVSKRYFSEIILQLTEILG